jgi:hypothetical protein
MGYCLATEQQLEIRRDGGASAAAIVVGRGLQTAQLAAYKSKKKKAVLTVGLVLGRRTQAQQ